jgi:hypothetical protein
MSRVLGRSTRCGSIFPDNINSEVIVHDLMLYSDECEAAKALRRRLEKVGYSIRHIHTGSYKPTVLTPEGGMTVGYGNIEWQFVSPTIDTQRQTQEEFDRIFKEVAGVEPGEARKNREGWLFIPLKARLDKRSTEFRDKFARLAGHMWSDAKEGGKKSGWWVRRPSVMDLDA